MQPERRQKQRQARELVQHDGAESRILQIRSQQIPQGRYFAQSNFLVDPRQGALHGASGAGPIAVHAQRERHRIGWRLRDRTVQNRGFVPRHLVHELGMFLRGDHPDNRQPWTFLVPQDPHPLADGLHARKVFADESFVHHGDRGRARPVLPVELPSAPQSDAQHLEIIVAHHIFADV